MSLAGWAYLFAPSFAIHRFELFGLQQVWQSMRGRPLTGAPFLERWMYRFDRHPIMIGVLVGMWVTPTMTLVLCCLRPTPPSIYASASISRSARFGANGDDGTKSTVRASEPSCPLCRIGDRRQRWSRQRPRRAPGSRREKRGSATLVPEQSAMRLGRSPYPRAFSCLFR